MGGYTKDGGYDQLEEDVRNHGDVLTVTMGELRDCEGMGRLGKFVVAAIDRSLRQRGLAYQGELELGQTERVRIYKQGTATAKLIEAIASRPPSEATDTVIRQYAEDSDSDVLQQIRLLVCV
jgi:hypothetical protein